MAYDPNVVRRATQRLAEQRSRREADFDCRRQELYRRLPQLARIDRALSRTYLDIVAASLRSGADSGPAIEDVKRNNQALQAQRAHVVKRLLAVFLEQEFLAAGGHQKGAAAVNDAADAAAGEDFVVVHVVLVLHQQAVVAALEAHNGHIQVGGGTHHGADGRVHAGRVAAAGQNADSFHGNFLRA